MKHTFLLSSAIKTKFGVYNEQQRLEQTIASIDSIKSRIPDAQIIIVECSGAGIEHEHLLTLSDMATFVVNMTKEPNVVALYNSTDNWDIVKNGTELMCFLKAIGVCYDRGIFDGQDRIHKMSGRYVLNDDFKPEFYELPEVIEKIVIGKKCPSQFDFSLTQQQFQYMSRLWSWPVSRTPEVLGVYKAGIQCFADRIEAKGYIDIEHVLCKFLNPNNLIECESLGIEGNISPNGKPVKD
jgi:hypothetical protein